MAARSQRRKTNLTKCPALLSNLGMFGIDTFTPIINKPEIAILGVGRMLDKPAVKDGEIVIQPRISCRCLLTTVS